MFEQGLEALLRRGAIPLCCGGASFCFALYACKVEYAALSWEALANQLNEQQRQHDDKENNNYNPSSRFEIASSLQQGNVLHQHAASCAALAGTSTAITVQAGKDWCQYRRKRSLDDIEQWILRSICSKRRFFVLRSPVLLTALLSFGFVQLQFGVIRLVYWPPNVVY